MHSVSPASNAIANSRCLGGEPICGANSALLAPAATNGRLGTTLNYLALAAANDTTILQQLTVTNLALTTSNAMLTATNKKLSEAVAAKGPDPAVSPGTTPGIQRPAKKPKPGNYCWLHGHRCSKLHTSATCGARAPGHQVTATASTRWEGVRRTRNGTPAPNGVGGRL